MLWSFSQSRGTAAESEQIGWTSVRKQQIRYAAGDERCGRRRVELLNPLGGETHKQGIYLDRWTKQKISYKNSGLIWFGSVYLVITAGFVADQLM